MFRAGSLGLRRWLEGCRYQVPSYAEDVARSAHFPSWFADVGRGVEKDG